MTYKNYLTSHISNDQLRNLAILKNHFDKVYLASTIALRTKSFLGHRTANGSLSGVTINEQEAYEIYFKGHTYIVAESFPILSFSRPFFYIREVDGQIAYHDNDISKPTSKEVTVMEQELKKLHARNHAA